MISPINFFDLQFIVNEYYNLDISKDTLHKINFGLTNITYCFEVACNKYILQIVNKKFRREIIDDILMLSGKLKKLSWQTIELLKTINGNYFAIYNDQIIRIYCYLEGSMFTERITIEKSFLLGEFLSKFHYSLQMIDYIPKHKIPNFHNFLYYEQTKKNYFEKNFLTKYANICNILQTNEYPILDDKIQLIHGDARLENILFDQNNNPFTLIDYDTFMLGSVFIDIGDLLRSIVLNNLKETNLKNIFNAFIEGYIGYNNLFRKILEIDRFYIACKYITIELCNRFLIDIVENSYFSWDENVFSSREDSNLYYLGQNIEVLAKLKEFQ